MSSQFGLTTEEALLKLKKNIEEELLSFSKSEKKWFYLITDMFNCDFIPLTWFGLVILVVEIIFLIIASVNLNDVRLVSICFEITLLVIFSTVLVICCVREHQLKVNEMRRLISSFVDTIVYDPKHPWSYEDYPDLSLPETNSISLIWTYRDSKIVNLPHNLLVEGDVIILGPSRTAPAECRQVTSNPHKFLKSVTLEAGDIFNPSVDNYGESSYQPYPRQRFEVLQAPARSMIQTYLQSSRNKRNTILDTDICAVIHIFETRIIWVILMVSLAVNVFRWLFLHKDVGGYAEMLFSFQAYSILPLLPVLYPVLWIAVTLYGTARLRILFEMYTKRSFDPTESEEISLDHVNCQQVLLYYWGMVIGNPQGLPRTVNLLHTLGSITTFCCVDKEGILCYTNPVPEKVFFFKDQKKMKHSHEISNLLDETCEFYVKKEDTLAAVTEEGSNNNDIEVLNISPDPKSPYGIQFDDSDWEQQLPSLKPLGVNMLLNSPCQYPIKSLRSQDFSRHLSLAGNHTVVPNFQGCLCPMAKQIGFKDRILSMFKNKQQLIAYRPLNAAEDNTPSEFFLSILKEKHVPLMIASVISGGKRGVSQLLAQGSADLILDACSDVWNGEEISPLTVTERKKALSFFQRMSITRKCVAFSYRPIFQEDCQNSDIFLEYPSQPIKKDSTGTPKERPGTKPEMWFKKVRSDIQCEDMLQHTSPCQSNIDVHIKNLQKQIFLGMVTLSHSLKEDVVSMVEHLNNAGIRFVHFSYDNELLSRVFCQRLGLETGWNCHISLGESHGTTTNIDDNSSSVSDACPLLNEEENELLDHSDIKVVRSDSYAHDKHYDQDDDYEADGTCYDNYNELYFMSNRSKLPKGIQNMRAHLERVDDVPLLVPLFTDCNSDAVAEMIAIMQEYGEIVCCTGSILNATNYKIFSQSDISIAMEPIFHQTCFLKQGHHLHEENLRGSTNADVSVSDPDVCELISTQGPLALSASLNNIPCSLSCRRQDNFPIAALLCEARRIASGCESCFLFLLSCQFSLSLLMLLSSFLLLPPPLSGLQLIWLITVIVPILSVSLIGTPADENVMKMITGKRQKKQILKGLVIPYIKQFIPTFVLNSSFISVCLFPWLLYSFCNTSSERDCHWLFGARNLTSPWHGWYGELKGGFFFAQDIILFTTTLSFIALSVSFVHRKNLIWRKSPVNNKPWCLCILITFLLQLLHSVCSIYHWTEERLAMNLRFRDIPVVLMVIGVIWLFVLVAISELLKRKYIRTNVRFQKRERLKFNTKLGMNSPV